MQDLRQFNGGIVYYCLFGWGRAKLRHEGFAINRQCMPDTFVLGELFQESFTEMLIDRIML